MEHRARSTPPLDTCSYSRCNRTAVLTTPVILSLVIPVVFLTAPVPEVLSARNLGFQRLKTVPGSPGCYKELEKCEPIQLKGPVAKTRNPKDSGFLSKSCGLGGDT